MIAVKENPLSTLGFIVCFVMFSVGMHSEFEHAMPISFLGAIGVFLIPFYVSRKPSSNEAES
jgi:mannitol-specific phosphotransferase system IIBC component